MKKVITCTIAGHGQTEYFYMSFLVIAVLMLFSGFVCADVIIDNGDSGTSSTGVWANSGGVDPYGSGSLWGRDGATYTWVADSLPAGTHEIFAWWTEYSSRSTAAPIQIAHADGVANTTVNQQSNGGEWNSLGQFYFDGSGSVTLTAPDGYPVSYSADAVKFVLIQANPRPIASIDSIAPNPADPAESILFEGSGTDDGDIAAYQWKSNLDDVIGTSDTFTKSDLSEGTHLITFKVQDDMGAWSAAVEDILTVGTPSLEIIIDNRDPETDSVGSWLASGGANPYDADSVYSRASGNSFSWLFTPPIEGQFELSMWWTELASRSIAAPITVEYADGVAALTVNQQTDGGQWNVLGAYRFEAGVEHRITISTLTNNSSISADAVRLVKVPDPPIVAAFEADILGGDMPLTVSFTDLSTGSDIPTAWAWDFDNDGTIDSTDQNPVHTYPSAGIYSVRLEVSGSEGSDILLKEDYIEVADPAAPYELIIDNGDPETSSTGVWEVSGGVPPWGVDSLWGRNTGSYTWRFTPEQTGVFEFYMWWTEFSSRGSALPVSIQNFFGTAETTVNQQIDGGQWNLLGTYYLEAGNPYNVTLSASGGSPTACADAVRIVRVPVDNLPPTATIDSIGPNPLMLGQEAAFSGSAQDVDGTVDAYQWSSDIDGPLSSDAEFETSALSAGVHTISLKAQDDDEAWSVATTKKVIVLDSAEIEHVYACFAYASERVNYQWEDMLVTIGAYEVDDLWVYTNLATDKSFVIYTVTSIEGMRAAMKEQDSVVLIYGHSNYGLGPIFPTSQEQGAQVIEELYYVDDDRILNISTDTIAVSISGMITSQAYPNWYPDFQDGSSAVAPYTFDDPRGDPPHNYYLTYQIPGDPNHYMIDSPREGPLERFPDCYSTPWYSVTGEQPDSSNPAHHEYFITNPLPWNPPFESTSDWRGSVNVDGYYGSNYLWVDAGSGSEQAAWWFNVPFAGQYDVFARWPASSGRTAAAPYTVDHALGSDTTIVSQKVNGGTWNSLGTFEFNAGQDWYESRYDDPALCSLNEENISGNSTKKAAFEASLSGNAYLTQKFDMKHQGNVRIEWDIYMDNILNDSSRDRGGMMFVGADVGSGPNRGSGAFVYMAFWSSEGDGGGDGDPNDMLSLVCREPGDSFNDSTQWNEVVTGLEYDRWYNIAVDCNTVSNMYDVYVDDVLVQSGVLAANSLYELTHISFAQWNDGAGAFYVDNVYGDTPNLIIDNQFDDSADTGDLLALIVPEYPVTLTNDTATGNVIADAVMISDVSNPPAVLEADFYSYNRSGSAPFDTSFSNLSTGDDETKTWNFGDGSPTVQTTNNSIAHTYPNDGTYTVSLTVSGSSGSDSVTKTDYIIVGGTTPQQVEFSASYREGSLPRNVYFRNRTSGDIQSVSWDFGDGTTDTISDRFYHSYYQPGNYDVTLTVTFMDDTVKSLTKNNFVRATVFEKRIDNVNYPNYHYRSKTILMRGPMEIDPAEMKYKRMFFLSCNSGSYYMQTLGRGVVHYSLDDTEVNPGTGFSLYLRPYMLGQSDDQILDALLGKQAAFDYYDFTKRPEDQ